MADVILKKYINKWCMLETNKIHFYSRAMNYIGITNRKLMNAGYQGPEGLVRQQGWEV